MKYLTKLIGSVITKSLENVNIWLKKLVYSIFTDYILENTCAF